MTDKTHSLILFVFIGVVNGQNCDNVCYKDVNNGLKHLKELYGKPPDVSNIPPSFEDIKSLINQTEYIITNIKDVDKTQNISISVDKDLNHISRKLTLLKQVITKINNINQTLEELQRKKEQHNKALTECNSANELYTQLKDNITSIKEYGNAIITAFGKYRKKKNSNRIDEVKKQSLGIKHALENINVSDVVLQKYICNSALHLTIEDIITILKNIIEELKRSFAAFIESKLEELNKNITEYEGYIEEIEKALEEKLPETDLKVTSGTRPLLDDLEAQVNDLKNKLKQIKLDLLGNARQKMADILNEYEQILNHIFSDNTEKKS
ncbi:hypothetical protein NQ318_023163 [Aromia moschata]|uniref:Uncharacterized protein n=1 Tax=Aromia moschata TaxID=1265417 RepID=A0AAV8X9Z0_9CUCU|nr:hypothetical protein NQ318_023163 [Aromia moschata]